MPNTTFLSFIKERGEQREGRLWREGRHRQKKFQYYISYAQIMKYGFV